MGNTDRPTATDLVKDLPTGHAGSEPRHDGIPQHLMDDVASYNFYQLVELIHQLNDEDIESDDWERKCRLLFSSKAGLGFAASDVSFLASMSGVRYQLETTFFGMTGSQSPLPGYLLEQIATEGETGLRKQFLDFFNHRLIALIYRIWRKYRYYIRFQDDASDQFSAQLFALVGLGDEHLRGETPINWCKMLSYAGMLAGRSRSPQVVCGILANCFDLEDVSIEQWQLRQVQIPAEQKCRLGMANVQLGHDCVIGDQVADRTGKFMICIKGLDQQRFRAFLPSGSEHKSLLTVVEFILREQMAFDLQLELMQEHAMPVQLNSRNPASLGWSSFTGQASTNRSVRIQIRQ